MTGTERCDRCWELETRIKGDPEIAARILASITASPTAEELLLQVAPFVRDLNVYPLAEDIKAFARARQLKKGGAPSK